MLLSTILIGWLVLTTPVILFLIFLFVAKCGEYDPSLDWLTQNDAIGNSILIAIPFGFWIGLILLIVGYIN